MTATTTSADAAPTAPSEQPARRDLLVLFSVLSVVTLGLGGWLTSLGFGPWYDGLDKPWFQPPGWVFSPVWTILFVLLAIATWQVARRGAVARTALRLYAVQLVLNVAWSLLFFTLSNPLGALVDIVILDVLVIAMALVYGRIHRAAGWMLVPYVVWLGLATTINAWIVNNN